MLEAMAMAVRPSLPASFTTCRSLRRSIRTSPTVSLSSPSDGSNKKQEVLVLYSKEGCCLCDGLKEKLHAALSLPSLHHVHLQVRDIATNPHWESLYQYEIPVLSKLLPDGTEQTLPRLSPRLSVELVQKKIAATFEEQ